MQSVLLLAALGALAGAHLDQSQVWSIDAIDDQTRTSDIDAINATNATQIEENFKANRTKAAPNRNGGGKISPVGKVVLLLDNLKKEVEMDGNNESLAYDKFACWCEDTIEEKTAEIANNKQDAATLQTSITKLGGQLASMAADIKQLQMDIADNLKSQKDNKEIRAKENAAFLLVRAEAERCISSLEGAISSLADAGNAKALAARASASLLQDSSGFLASVSSKQMQEAQVIGSLGSIRRVLSKPELVEKVSDSDLALLRQFVQGDSVSAMQVDNENSAPGGNYAPASDAIVGILKGMYDGFSTQLESDNGDEANKQKAWEQLRATNMMELATYKATLVRAQADESARASLKATNKADLKSTSKTLASNEKFLAKTTDSCKRKGMAWNKRTRLRAEELQGFIAAIEILNSSDAQSTFKNAANTFFQDSVAEASTGAETAMFLQISAARSASLKASAHAQIASQMGGHFDNLAGKDGKIDQMVKILATESAKDVSLKISCEQRFLKNKHNTEDVQKLILEMNRKIGYLGNWSKNLNIKMNKLNASMTSTRKTINAMKAQRLDAHTKFEKTTNDDLASIALLDKATGALNAFYARNKIGKTHLVEDEDGVKPMPRDDISGTRSATGGTDANEYGGDKSATGGIVAIIEMITSDLKGEVKDGRREEAEQEEAYEADLAAAEGAFEDLKAAKAEALVENAATNRKRSQLKGQDMTQLQTDNANLVATRVALDLECIFLVNKVVRGGKVLTEFQDRIANRAAETKGLSEAKTFLLGATVQ